MNCSQCGQAIPTGATSCANCGAAVNLAAPPPPGAGIPSAAPPGAGIPSAAPPGASSSMPVGATPASPGASAQFSFDFKKLSREERISGIATLVLLISLFLPWVTLSYSTLNVGYSSSFSGLTLHGYFYLVLIISLAVIALIVLKAGFGALPFKLPISNDQALLIGTAISFVIVLIGFLIKGYNGGTYSGFGYHSSIGYGFGAFIGLIAAIVAAAPYGWPLIQQRMGNKSAS
jgi:hypothetical protein